MTTKTKISIYNFLTVVFAMLTVISMGSIGSTAMHIAFINTAVFALLTYLCFDKENALRASLKKRRQRKVQLSVYNSRKSRQAA